MNNTFFDSTLALSPIHIYTRARAVYILSLRAHSRAGVSVTRYLFLPSIIYTGSSVASEIVVNVRSAREFYRVYISMERRREMHTLWHVSRARAPLPAEDLGYIPGERNANSFSLSIYSFFYAGTRGLRKFHWACGTIGSRSQ